MKIGFNEATARDCSSLEKDILLCDEVGFETIELRIDMLKTYLENHTKAQLATLLDSARVRPVNLNAVYPYEELFSSQDTPKRQKRFLDDFYLACELAQLTGAKALVLCPPLKADRRTPFEGSIQALHEMNLRIVSRLAREAERSGTKLGFEIVGARYSACRDLAAAKAILDELGLENLGLTVDTYNLYMGTLDSSFSDMAMLCAEDILIAHINDADYVPLEQVGDQSHRCFPGKGFLDMDAYLRSLLSIGYDGVVSVETFRPEYWARPAEWVIGEAYRATHAAMERNGCLRYKGE